MSPKVKPCVIHLTERKMITERDKTLIAGINPNNRPKLAPEYQPEPPYAYPLFKIHKLSREDITNKKIPPSRLVHASKFSPLYRMEKWTSPHLTRISREYCKEEFILDTSDLIGKLEEMNQSKEIENENVHLFTLDVEKLYPSIRPDIALQAIQETLSTDSSTDRKLKSVLETFVKMSFEHSYVSYKNECYKSKVGIPTGGSLSRQIADIVLHWILFKKMKLKDIQAIRFWRRFIDDCTEIWRGSRRSFDIFVKQLNAHCMKYGIKFPLNEAQFGKSVHMLDLLVYLDENNNIHYRGYTKPTDSKRYLNPSSFHPQSVFNSIPFSQMLRVIRNNSKVETRNEELEQCIKTFSNSGYKTEQLLKLKEKALNRISSNNGQVNNVDTLVFPLHYFDGITDFKSVVKSLSNEFRELIGDTRIMFAMRKNSSIGNTLVRNKQLSLCNDMAEGQKCNARGCRQCPLVLEKEKIIVNGSSVNIPRSLNCKSRNIIYMWVCKLCGEKEVYFGRTTQECHDRTSGHRGSFTEEKLEKSALSMHAKNVHQTKFSFFVTLHICLS